MAKMGCVIGWTPNPDVKGATNLTATTCTTLIAGLSMIIARQQLGMELSDDEIETINTCIKMYEENVLTYAAP